LRTVLLSVRSFPEEGSFIYPGGYRWIDNESEFHSFHLVVWHMDDRLIEREIQRSGPAQLVDIPTKQGWVALHLAAWNEDMKTLDLLGRNGASISVTDKLGWTALHWAASGGSEEAIKWLIISGIDVNARTKRGETALHIAAERGRFNVITSLIEAGVDASAKDNARETASDVALLAPVKWREATREALHDY
jgi:hypothetical protein